jgi:hypothetical protein
MTHGADPAELFDIQMDQLARLLAFIAPDRFGQLKRTELVQPQPAKNAANGSGRNTSLGGDLLAGPALPPLTGSNRIRRVRALAAIPRLTSPFEAKPRC